MESNQPTTATPMEPITDIAVLYSHSYDTPTTNCVVLLTLKNGPRSFYCENVNYPSNPELSFINPSMIDICKECYLKKQPMFFKVTITGEKTSINKILNISNTFHHYLLDEVPLDTVFHLLQMKHDLEMNRLKQDMKDSLRLFKSRLGQTLFRMESDINEGVTDLYNRGKLL